MVRFLLENGADVKAKDTYDQTPLSVAITERLTAAVRLLVENGADVNAASDGQTLLSIALAMGLTAVTGLLRDYGAETKPEDDIKKEVTKP